ISEHGWTTAAADTYTVLLHAGRRRPTGWEHTCAQVRQALGDRAAVIECPPARGPLARALGNKPIAAIVRPDGHVYALLDPAGPTALAAAVERARTDPQPVGGA
ncbi:hypothetical protein, partial [Streptomyces sp. SAS_270]|uniref:hypothetical protein n=1 Tax=Streptomyces sp. SAS_270 TaxID=3412748 RepID=UPI00403CDBD9